MMKAKRRSAGERGHNLKWLLSLLFVAIFLASTVPTASAGWDYYREIEIDNTQVSGNQDLSSFPVLISLTENWLKDSDHGGGVKESHGYDIVFTDSVNANKLDYEIEKYDGAAGTLVAWVRIPTLDYNDNTQIRLYYGNSAATDWSNPTGVWDTNYKSVWHLNETTGGAGAIKDSTSNDNDGTDYGSPNLDVAGQIDGADDFDGTNDYIEMGDVRGPSTAITISGWFRVDSTVGGHEDEVVIIKKYSGSEPWNSYSLWISANTNAKVVPRLFMGISGHYYQAQTTVGLSANEWHFIAGTWSSGDYLRFYVDGEEVVTSASTVSGSINYGNYNTIIGYNWGDNKYSDALIDDVRLSDTARSGDWIKTCYNNQNSPSTFYSVKGATGTGGTDPVPELPTVILFAVGLVVLAGYVMLRRRE